MFRLFNLIPVRRHDFRIPWEAAEISRIAEREHGSPLTIRYSSLRTRCFVVQWCNCTSIRRPSLIFRVEVRVPVLHIPPVLDHRIDPIFCQRIWSVSKQCVSRVPYFCGLRVQCNTADAYVFLVHILWILPQVFSRCSLYRWFPM